MTTQELYDLIFTWRRKAKKYRALGDEVRAAAHESCAADLEHAMSRASDSGARPAPRKT